MKLQKRYPTPIKVRVPEVGYNYVCGYGQFLSKEFFKRVEEFGDSGFAEVETFEGVVKKINKDGELFEVKVGH